MNHPVSQHAKGIQLELASRETQKYKPPVVGNALQISASDMATKVVKNAVIVQPQITLSYIVKFRYIARVSYHPYRNKVVFDI